MESSILRARPKHFPANRRPVFYYITDRRSPGGNSLLRRIRKVIDLGVDFIQIREKDLSDRELFALVSRVADVARGTRSRVLVNGRADIALAAGADGVHLPASGLRISEIRSWTPKNFIVGISVHTLSEIRVACECRVDYILVGHVFPTDSKAGMGPDLGLDFLRQACALSTVPVLALGGINTERIEPVLETGADGIAGISLFQNKEEFHRFRRFHKRKP